MGAMIANAYPYRLNVPDVCAPDLDRLEAKARRDDGLGLDDALRVLDELRTALSERDELRAQWCDAGEALDDVRADVAEMTDGLERLTSKAQAIQSRLRVCDDEDEQQEETR